MKLYVTYDDAARQVLALQVEALVTGTGIAEWIYVPPLWTRKEDRSFDSKILQPASQARANLRYADTVIAFSGNWSEVEILPIFREETSDRNKALIITPAWHAGWGSATLDHGTMPDVFIREPRAALRHLAIGLMGLYVTAKDSGAFFPRVLRSVPVEPRD